MSDALNHRNKKECEYGEAYSPNSHSTLKSGTIGEWSHDTLALLLVFEV